MLLLAGLCAVPEALAAPPLQDSVTGVGTSGFWGAFDVDVRSGPNGEDPAGRATFKRNAVETGWDPSDPNRARP